MSSPMTSEAWAQARPCIDKVTGGQLRSWMEFLLLQGRQPLPEAAAGKLAPLVVAPSLRCGVESVAGWMGGLLTSCPFTAL